MSSNQDPLAPGLGGLSCVPGNLNELTEYSDPVDQWAARREFELRSDRYELARIGALGALRRVRDSLLELNAAFVGYDADDPKHPDYHDTMSEVWDSREGK